MANDRVNVLQVCSWFPISYHGGITNYLRTLISELEKKGVRSSVVCGPDPKASSIIHGDVFEYDNGYRPFETNYFAKDKCVKPLLDLIQDKNPDIIHIHSSANLTKGFHDGIANLGIPYVVSLHDYFYICPRIVLTDRSGDPCRGVDPSKCCRCWGVLDQLHRVSRAAKRYSFKLPIIPSSNAQMRLEGLSKYIDGASALLPVSFRVEELFRQVFPNGKYKTIHIGSASYFAQTTPKIDFEGKVRATIIGMLNKIKGAEILERMIREMNGAIEFHFYGRSQDGYKERFVALGGVWHGEYSPSDLPGIMARSDIGIVPPVWEDNGPQVVMEFLNNGVPVLGTSVGGIPDFVSNMNGWLFHPDNDLEFAEAMNWLRSQNRESLAQIASGIKKLKSPSDHAGEVLDVYNSILKGFQ